MRKFLILIIIFYILSLLQDSFLPHFDIKGYTLNLILISVIIINLFNGSRRQGNSGLGAAFIGGFFLDIFSENFIGFYILILLGLALLISGISQYIALPWRGRLFK
jgi:rod shape-determining protein MreD